MRSVRSAFTALFTAMLVALVLGGRAAAQCEQFTPQFAPSAFDDYVHALLRFDAGSGPELVAGGNFGFAGRAPAKRIARWNGASWQELDGGIQGAFVKALEHYDDGSGEALFVGGLFNTAGGVPASSIARWSPTTGWSALGVGPGDAVEALCAFDDGMGTKLYVGGRFIDVGIPAAHVACWDGTQWSALGTGLAGDVYALTVHDDGNGPKLYAGGLFPGRVARWDGTNWTTVGSGLSANVHSLASFPTPGGAPRLFAGDGDAVVAPGVWTWNGANWFLEPSMPWTQRVNALRVLQDELGTALWIGNGHSVVRWNDSSSQVFETDQFTHDIEVLDEGSTSFVYSAGRFGLVEDVACTHIARWDGASWGELPGGQHGFEGARVYALAEWTPPGAARSVVVAGGEFTSVDDIAANHVASWDGQKWSALGNGLVGTVLSLLQVDEPALGGPALFAAQLLGAPLLKYDDHWQVVTGGPSSGIFELALYQAPGATSASLFVAGSFGSGAFHRIAAYDGQSWSDVGGGFNNTVTAMCVFDPPGAAPAELYVTGQFSAVGGQPATKVERWNGSSWSPVVGGATPTGVGSPLTVWDDGTGPALYLLDSWLRRWDGSTWTALAPSPQSSSTLVGFDSGSTNALYSGPHHRYLNGQWSQFTSSNGVLDTIAMLSMPPGSSVGRSLWLGGGFTQFNGIGCDGIARWSDPCAASTTYCTAKVNSLGCSAAIGWSGEPSIAGTATVPFVITASDVLSNKAGLFFYGVFGRKTQPFQGGTLCLRGPYKRSPVQQSGGNATPDCSGTYSLDYSEWIQGLRDPNVSVGITVDGQWWYRDPPASFSVGFSDAIEFEVRP